MGALNYNLKKLNHPDKHNRAELLDTNFSSMNTQSIKKEVDYIKQLRPNLNRYVYHTSLNFSREEQAGLSNEKLLNIAKDYLAANGFTDNQYLIFRHYDAEHPHLHLLVNRVRFDGNVVSDSNNYQRSEAILRNIELKYKLNPVISSRQATQRPATKGELEKTIRTGHPSDKLVLQELMNGLLKERNLTIAAFIQKAEMQGIRILFNTASTGRVSGVTYFYNDFKIKGQVLGNKYKWAELIKTFNYEQNRDSKAISQANSRTKGIYGDYSRKEVQQPATEERRDRNGSNGIHTGGTANPGNNQQQPGVSEETGSPDQPVGERSLETGQDADNMDNNTPDFDHHRFDGLNFEITDDEDDAKYRRRSRGMGR